MYSNSDLKFAHFNQEFIDQWLVHLDFNKIPDYVDGTDKNLDPSKWIYAYNHSLDEDGYNALDCVDDFVGCYGSIYDFVIEIMEYDKPSLSDLYDDYPMYVNLFYYFRDLYYSGFSFFLYDNNIYVYR